MARTLKDAGGNCLGACKEVKYTLRCLRALRSHRLQLTCHWVHLLSLRGLLCKENLLNIKTAQVRSRMCII